MAEVMIDPAGYRRMSAHNVADARQYRWPEITARLADLYRDVLSGAR
jgi:hypothetical protein